MIYCQMNASLQFGVSHRQTLSHDLLLSCILEGYLLEPIVINNASNNIHESISIHPYSGSKA